MYNNIDFYLLCYVVLFIHHGVLFQPQYYNTNIRADRLWKNLVRKTQFRKATYTIRARIYRIRRIYETRGL